MSIWNKILVGFICVFSLVFFYMASRTLKTQQYWRDLAQKHQEKIDQLKKANQKLLDSAGKEGQLDELGIRQLRQELYRLLIDRRRAWFQCESQVKVDRENGTATVNLKTEQAEPMGIAENTLVYAFEGTSVEKKGRYLGEFKVTRVGENQKSLVMEPTTRLADHEIERLAEAKRVWDIYEVMPRDNHEVFASLSDTDLKAMLPPSVVPEYAKDGKPAETGDDPERVVDGKYQRWIRDYRILLDAAKIQYMLLTDQIKATTRNKNLVETALALAKTQSEAAKKDVADAVVELQKYTREKDIVETYRKSLEKELAAVEADIAHLIETNQAMAGRIAKLQLEAARRIDQRTRAMAQSGARGQ